MYRMVTILWTIKVILLIIMFQKGVNCIKNVILTLEPSIVQQYHNCTLICTYDLEGLPLYTVKWYRGTTEFYRYTPYEKPPTKVFNTTGINVDETRSNSTQVILQNVGFNLSGNFTCEVTTEKAFSTGQDVKVMQVVQLPDNPPTISVSREPLDYGDVLTAKCMSPPSKPLAALKFLLNNKMVARTDPFILMTAPQKPEWSDLELNLTLTQEHFDPGRLILRCEAYILDIYHEEAKIRLNTARDPVSQRVSAYNSANLISMAITPFLVIIYYLNFVVTQYFVM